MLKRVSLVVALCVAATTLSGCSLLINNLLKRNSEDATQSQSSKDYDKLVLSGINFNNDNNRLVLFKDDSGDITKNKIYSLDLYDGSLKDVETYYCWDNICSLSESNGNYYPTDIMKLDDGHIFLEYKNKGKGDYAYFFGDAHNFTRIDEEYAPAFWKKGYIVDQCPEDEDGNIYYLSSDGKIIKMSIGDNIEYECISLETDNVRLFYVDYYGNAAYEGSNKRTDDSVLRYISKNGEVENLPGSPNHSATFFFPGGDGLYYHNPMVMNDYGSSILKIHSDPFSLEAYPCTMASFDYIGYIGATYSASNSTLYLFNKDAYWNVFSYPNDYVLRKPISGFGLSRAVSIRSNMDSNYLYVYGYDDSNKPCLVRRNMLYEEYEFISSNRFELTDWLVTNDDIVCFCAYDLKEKRYVSGIFNFDCELYLGEQLSNSGDLYLI